MTNVDRVREWFNGKAMIPGEGMVDSLAAMLDEAEALGRVAGTDYGVGVPGLIAEECSLLRQMLFEKNAAYGNSALDPLRVFSKADPEEQIRVRLDDKLSRLSRGSASGEDVEQDLLGYLILLRVARKLKQRGLTP